MTDGTSIPAQAVKTVAEGIRRAAARMASTSDTARLDAEVLMAHALGVDRSRLLLSHMRDTVPQGFDDLIERRIRHEPVAYITGTQEFFGLAFRVGPEVLIPRGDSETLVDAALAAHPEAKRVLDCGTGSGALLLAVLANMPEAEGIGIDRSPEALAMAQSNANALGIADRSHFRLADWHQPGWSKGLLPGSETYDVVLANPPYVETDADLDPSVRDFEPSVALFAGPDGLDDYRVLVPQLPDLLAPGGVALVEIGHEQADDVSAIGRASGLAPTLRRDLAGRARVIVFSRIT